MYTHIDWYDENEQRQYPFTDEADLTTSEGTALPCELIADATIVAVGDTWPDVRLSGITVSPNLVTAVFEDDTHTTLFTVYAANPQPYVCYPIEPTVYGSCSGWVSFGTGVAGHTAVASYTMKPGCATLLPKCITAVARTELYKFGVEGYDNILTGIVALKSEGDIKLSVESRAIPKAASEKTINLCEEPSDCECVEKVLVMHLDKSKRPNVVEDYAGKCGGRAETNTCGRQAIRTVNTLQPLCDGNIILDFSRETDDDINAPHIVVAEHTAHGVYLNLDVLVPSICETNAYSGPTDKKECDTVDII